MTEIHEPSLREQLLTDYEQHEDRIERASITELWELGDWLAAYVPPRHPGPAGVTPLERPISIEDLAECRGRSRAWLRELRKVALATEADRLPQITPRAYTEALRQHGWDLMAANASLVTKGHRLRDQAGKMESVDALKASLAQRDPEERADVARELAADPTVAEIMQGQPVPDLGAAWADNYVVRLDEQAAKLTSLVAREGLVFSPETPLQRMLEFLERTEQRLADVRAAVQERLQDAQMEGVS